MKQCSFRIFVDFVHYEMRGISSAAVGAPQEGPFRIAVAQRLTESDIIRRPTRACDSTSYRCIHIDLIKIAIIRQSCILITRSSRPFLGQNEWMFRLSGNYDDRETPTKPLTRSAFCTFGWSRPLSYERERCERNLMILTRTHSELLKSIQQRRTGPQVERPSDHFMWKIIDFGIDEFVRNGRNGQMSNQSG